MENRIFRIVVLGLIAAWNVGAVRAQDSVRAQPGIDLAARIAKLEQQQKRTASPTTVGGVIFGSYVYSPDGVGGVDYNRFDLDRSYFTVRSQLAESWKVQLTADLIRWSETGDKYTGLVVRMKFGYVDYSPAGISVKMGLIPGAFNSIEESAWKYRVIASTPSDRYGYLATADLGVSATYALPEKMGEVAGYIINGKGYSSPEADKFKEFILRTNVAPFVNNDLLKSLMVGAYYSTANENSAKYGGLPKNRFGAMVAYSYDIISAGFIYNTKNDAAVHPDTSTSGNVISMFGELKSPWPEFKQFSLIGRVDLVEPNTSKAGDQIKFLIGGLVYKPNDKLTFALDCQLTFGELSTTLVKTGGGTIGDDTKLFLHMVTVF
jgi:hypothetical protein